MKTYSPGAITIAMQTTTSKVAEDAIKKYEAKNPTQWPEAFPGATQKESKSAWQQQKKVMTPQEAWTIYDKSKKEFIPVASPSAGKTFQKPPKALPRFYTIPSKVNATVMKWAEAFAKTPVGGNVKTTLEIAFPEEK